MTFFDMQRRPDGFLGNAAAHPAGARHVACGPLAVAVNYSPLRHNRLPSE
jgi:hypothetical protein